MTSSRQLIADAEGVTHVLVVDVRGAADEGDARAVARPVADSPLVKTAAVRRRPEPRAGPAGGQARPACRSTRHAIDVAIGDVTVASGGVIPPAYFEAGALSGEAAHAAMKEPEIAHHASTLGDGPGERALGCDLSYDYVRINGEYTT